MSRGIIVPKLSTFKQACDFVRRLRIKGKRTAFTSGCFDIVHVGHILFLEECKQGADALIIGVDDNATVHAAKGIDHPYFDETERVKVLDALELVDRVFIFRGPCSDKLIAELKPDWYCFSPYDPKRREKQLSARRAHVKAKLAGFSLKSWSSSRAGRMLRVQFMTEPWILPPEK